MEYVDFDLSLRPESDGYSATAKGPGGAAATASLRPFPEKELSCLAASLFSEEPQFRDLGVSRRVDPDRFGERLFEAVFVGEVKACFLSSLAAAKAAKKGLRLRLDLPSRLASWPWEYLRYERSFLAISTTTPVVRHLEVTTPVQPLCVRMPLRVLVVAANPAGLERLKVEEEYESLRRILGSWALRCRIKVERLEPPTLAALTAQLGQKDYHVLHFIGHGRFDRDRKDGFIALEKKGGGKDWVGGSRLADLLRESSLRLVILNACEGACSADTDRFGGVAQSLMQKNFPAVIAMQRPVTDQAAIAFSKSFYRGLAKGKPIDAVLSRVRHHLYAGFEPEWATPVLHMRSPDGQLFRPWPGPWAVASAMGLLGLGVAAALLNPSVRLPPSEPTVAPVSSIPASDPRCPSPSGLDINFAYIEPGGLQLGRTTLKVEKPFCIGRFEVTQKQWEAVMGPVPGSQTGEDLPVGRVTLEDARRFAEELEMKEPGGGYRLPTGDQWEYAARGGSKGRYSFGDNSNALPAYGNCKNGDAYQELAPVGRFKANRSGLYDVHGNAWEWVEEGHRRGGSYESSVKKCEVSSTSSVSTSQADNGLRLVRSPVPPVSP